VQKKVELGINRGGTGGKKDEKNMKECCSYDVAFFCVASFNPFSR